MRNELQETDIHFFLFFYIITTIFFYLILSLKNVFYEFLMLSIKVSSIYAIIEIDYVVFLIIYLYLDIEIIQRIK